VKTATATRVAVMTKIMSPVPRYDANFSLANVASASSNSRYTEY
jgi:hypothetical protein